MRAIAYVTYAVLVTWIQVSHGWHGFYAGGIYCGGLVIIGMVR